MIRPLVTGIGVLALLFGLSGSGGTFSGLGEVPLPGGPDLGSDPLHITVMTRDVLSLARQSSVKVDDVTVGRVDSIERDGWQAKVTLSVRREVSLPANATAMIRQTGLLGEKFVELAPPYDEPPRGHLTDGATISVDRTGRSFEVEEVLGALSTLLNDGGLDRLQTITSELHSAMDGRESDVRELLRRLTTVTTTLDENRESIVDAIDGMDELARNASQGTRTIARALDDIGPAVAVLADQRGQLTRLLRAAERLGTSGTRTITAVRQDLVANLELLRPTLRQLAGVGKDLPEAIPYLLSYPFPDRALSAFKGDYVNFDAALRVDLEQLLNPSRTTLPAVPSDPATPTQPDGDQPADPELPGSPDLPGVDLSGLTNLLDVLGLHTPRSTP